MAHCTYTELANLTGSVRTQTVLEAVIDEADRQVNTYLKAHGVNAVSNDATKSASLSMSKAGLLELGLQEGSFQASSADFTSSVDVTSAVKALRAAAYATLDDYIAIQLTLVTPRKVYLAKVNGRC